MEERKRRIGQNEALFRTVNEEVENLNRGLAGISDGTLHMVCECGELICNERLIVPLDDYERVRADSALFFVIPGHEKPSAEDVVETATRYYIVRKHPGGPEQLAEATDPRSASA